MNADRGAARERTALAWRRTALAFALNGVLLLRASDVWVQVAALLVIAFATASAAAAATAFRGPAVTGWFAAGRLRAAVAYGATTAVCVLDVIAIVR